MRRPTGLVLLSLSLLLVIFPLTVGKPGLPMTLKADEPAYYLMALSLARDLDLRCELRDLGRLFDEYPYLATFNLILMTDDGWRTVYFGKPYLYSLFAAPLAAVFGANGLIAFNMLLLVGMTWMGAAYLRRFNSPPLAALYAAGFFLVSTSFAYVFWMHPEIFNMACVAGSLFLALHEFDDGPARGRLARLRARLFGPGMRPLWSGALLALAAYNKPMLVALGVPAIFVYWRRRDRRAAVLWMATAVLAIGSLAGLSVALTGHPSAYLGVERMGVPVFDPQQMPVQQVPRPPDAQAPTTNSWAWLLRIPEVDLGELATNLRYFFWGRHTGLIPYMPFAVLSVLLFLLNARRSPERWLTLAAAAAVGLYFLIWIPFNWHGGGGFIGNRYFVNVYPAFLFLVTRVTPAWLPAVGFAFGGLLLGPILFTPFGAPVPEPTLQAHVRNPPFRWLPLELEFRDRLPGYRGVAMSGAWFYGRKDVFRARNEELLLHGATPVELWMLTAEPLQEPVTFAVRNQAPANRIGIDLAGDRLELSFSASPPEAAESRQVQLRPRSSPRRLKERRRWVYAYRLLVRTRTGVEPEARRNARRKHPINEFYLGAALAYLGTASELERDLYHVRWGDCQIPRQATAGRPLIITASFTNGSTELWPATGPARVNLSYHWLDEEGEVVVWEGRRSPLPTDVAPGSGVALQHSAIAPEQPGRYQLELDLVRERVSWFSRWRPQEACRSPVEVVPAAATADSPEP